MRPTDVAERLNRLAELAGENRELRRLLENLDLIAQAAVDNESTYVNKKGDAVTAPAPQWAVVLNAQKLAAQLLGLTEPEVDEKGKDKGSIASVERRLGLVKS